MTKFSIFNFQFSIAKRQRGQLLIEAMVGLSIALVGLLGIVGLVSRSASLNRVVSEHFIATYLASEGIEITKNIIDGNIIQSNPWNLGFNTGSFEADYASLNLLIAQNRNLKFDSSTGFYSYEKGDETPFVRTIDIELIDSDEIKVNSIVKWTTRGGAEFEINVEDHFFNWRS